MKSTEAWAQILTLGLTLGRFPGFSVNLALQLFLAVLYRCCKHSPTPEQELIKYLFLSVLSSSLVRRRSAS